MAEYQRHRVLRECLRHFLEFEGYCQQSGQWFVEHRGIQISFLDLQRALTSLSPRKKEAIFYNVILDYKQKDVAAIMGITTVSVGQYVEQGCAQIAKHYFAETNDGEGDDNVRQVHGGDPRPDVGSEGAQPPREAEQLGAGESEHGVLEV
jgi:hypothetical protein